MNNFSILLEAFGPAGDSRFQQCYRCDFSYDVLNEENMGGCPACGGCGECGCCPCKKQSCTWCADEELSDDD